MSLFFSRTLCLIAGFLAVSISAEARVAKSVSYDLEYATVAAGSGSTTSGDYGLVGSVITEGLAVGVASSPSYSTEPVVGSTTGINSSVADWMLF